MTGHTVSILHHMRIYQNVLFFEWGVTMGIVSEVKCYRCDRRYSGFRGRCPYCGARRSKRGKHASNSGNSRGRLIIGILILLILVVAAVFLLSKTVGDNKKAAIATATPAPTVKQDENVVTITGSPMPTTSATPSPSASASAVKSAKITYAGSTVTDISMKVAEVVTLKCVTDPSNANVTATWSSGDDKVFVVVQNGTVTAVGTGTATLTVSIGGQKATCIIRVSAK